MAALGHGRRDRGLRFVVGHRAAEGLREHALDLVFLQRLAGALAGEPHDLVAWHEQEAELGARAVGVGDADVEDRAFAGGVGGRRRCVGGREHAERGVCAHAAAEVVAHGEGEGVRAGGVGCADVCDRAARGGHRVGADDGEVGHAADDQQAEAHPVARARGLGAAEHHPLRGRGLGEQALDEPDHTPSVFEGGAQDGIHRMAVLEDLARIEQVLARLA